MAPGTRLAMLPTSTVPVLEQCCFHFRLTCYKSFMSLGIKDSSLRLYVCHHFEEKRKEEKGKKRKKSCCCLPLPGAE